MALLNYALLLTDAIKEQYLSKYINSQNLTITNSKQIDKVALVFTGDGHIITHDFDYTQNLLNKIKVVENSIATNGLTKLDFRTKDENTILYNKFQYTKDGGTSWIDVDLNINTAAKVANALTIKFNSLDTGKVTYDGSSAQSVDITAEKIGALTQAMLTLGKAQGDNVAAEAFDYNTTKIYSAARIDQLLKESIDNAITASMVYKGTISNVTTTSATAYFFETGTNARKLADDKTNLVKAEVGDVYKVAVAGKYKIGNTDYTLEVGDTLICEAIDTNKYPTLWNVLQNNIESLSITVNTTSAIVYGNGLPTTLFVPTSEGTSGQILKSTGNAAPTWTDVNPKISITSGSISISVLGKNATAVDLYTKLALKAGVGLTFGSNESFNGSAERTLSLKSATINSFKSDGSINASGLGGIALYSAQQPIKLSTGSETGITKLNALTSTANRYYQVATDKNNVAYVNVPWQDTNTWRPISYGIRKYLNEAYTSTLETGKTLGNNRLRFEPGENIFLIPTQITYTEGQTTVTEEVLKFDLAWYNLDSKKYEL